MAHVPSSLLFIDDNSLLAGSCQALQSKRLHEIIHQWNSTQLDLFEISKPDKDLEFHGVMRFYFQDNAAGDCATKCIQVSSTSTTQNVIETLLGKFRPNISTEPFPYAMYEVCGDKERKMDLNEKPLMVQLCWNTNAKQSSFILKNDNIMALQNNCLDGKEKLGVLQNFKRTLTKKQKIREEMIKENANCCLLERGKLSSSRMNHQNNQEQKIDAATDLLKTVMCPAKSESCMIKNELKSGHGKHKSFLQLLDILVKPTGKTDCRPTVKPYNMEIIEPVTQKQYETFEPQNKSTISQNSSLKWHLPLSIKLSEKKEDSFLRTVVDYTNSSTVHFKLSPAYAFYLTSRFMLTQSEQKNKPPKKTAEKVVTIINRIVHLTNNVIQKQRNIAVALAFWMANASELLNFIRNDSNLTGITLDSQKALAQLVQKTFKFLSQRLRADLESHLPAFFFRVGQLSNQAAEIGSVLTSLTRTMSLLRRCRVNPALSIQLFSQLFHFMGAWLLNRLTMASSDSNLCSCFWGTTLCQRLSHVETWAMRQGLELAADCHLSRIIQATTLLTMNSYSIKDAEKIYSTCFKLNSLQLRALMTKYHYAPMQPHIPQDLIDCIVTMAENIENEILKKEGEDIRIEEELELHLPFILPEEGFSCETVQGIPHGFQEFLEPLCCKGLCTLVPEPISLGSWTVYFQTSDNFLLKRSSFEPEVVKMALKKPLQSVMGISIVAAKGAGQKDMGIFIKSIVNGGAANMDGRLEPGDQLLSVDGKSLIGVSQERAADIMLSSGSTVILEIVKFAAVHYGLEEVLNQLPHTASKDGDCETAGRKSGDLEVDDRQCLTLYAPSMLPGIRGNHHTINRVIRKQSQMWLKHRLEYRSNPNLAYSPQHSEEMSMDSVIHKQKTTSISNDNRTAIEECFLSNSGPDQEFSKHLSLPASKLQGSKLSETAEQTHLPSAFSWDENKSAFVKHTHSQHNICSVNRGGPLVDRNQCLNKWSKQTSAELNASGPNRRSRDGYWKTMPVHSKVISQPKRIDVPVSLANTLSFAELHNPARAVDLRAYGQIRNPQPMSSPNSCHLQKQKGSMHILQIYNSTKDSQKEKVSVKIQAMMCQSKSEVNTSKMSPSHLCHSFGHQNLHYAGDGPSPNPWSREAREQLEKQHRHWAMDLLEKEVLQLQAKVPHTPEETERLRRLSLELQFQKRLQELQNNREEEEEEKDEDEKGSIMQQLKTDSNKKANKEEPHNIQNLRESQNQLPQQMEDHDAKRNSIKDEITEGCTEIKTQRIRICPRELNHKSFKEVKDPENLTFKERQQLFSLAMSKPSNVA